MPAFVWRADARAGLPGRFAPRNDMDLLIFLARFHILSRVNKKILTLSLVGIFYEHPAPSRGAPRACSWRGNGMRWSATMPGSGRLRGLRFLKADGAHTPATRADGPSAGPGDSSHERGASAVATNPGACSKPQIHRVRNAGEYCFRGGLGLETGWAPTRMSPAKRRAGARVSIAKKAYGRSHANAGAAGAAIRPVVPHSPSGQRKAKRRQRPSGKPCAGSKSGNDMACLPPPPLAGEGRKVRSCMTIQNTSAANPVDTACACREPLLRTRRRFACHEKLCAVPQNGSNGPE